MQKYNSFFNGAVLVLALCVLLDLKKVVYYSDSVSVAITGFLFVICFICAFKVLSRKKGRHGFLLAFTALMLMFTVYGGICILNGDEYTVGSNVYSSRMYIMDIFISLLPTYAFYYYSSIGQLSIKALKRFFFISAALSIILFFKYSQDTLQNATNDIEGIVNNGAYTILSLLLGVSLFMKRRIIQYSIFAFVAVFLLLGLKRGAMLIYPFCLFFFLNVALKNAPKKHRIFTLLVFFVFICFLVWYIQYRYSNDAFFQSRLELTEEGNSSSRDILFSTFWDHFKYNPNILQILFGEGAMATVKISFNFAHNDWLEILINEGLFGVIIYLVYWISLIKVWLKSKRIDPSVYLTLGLFVIIYFMRSLYSMGYTGCGFFTTAMLGFSLNQFYNQEHFSSTSE